MHSLLKNHDHPQVATNELDWNSQIPHWRRTHGSLRSASVLTDWATEATWCTRQNYVMN